MLAYVYIKNPRDWLRKNRLEIVLGKEDCFLSTADGFEMFLNAFIVQHGYASLMTIPPNVKHADLFKKIYQEARENKRGLWR